MEKMHKGNIAKVKNTIWASFIVVAFLVTGFCIFQLYSIYNGNGQHYHDDACGHDHSYDSFIVTPVDFRGIDINLNGVDRQKIAFVANSRDYLFSDNTICKNPNNGDIYWYSEADNSVYHTSGSGTERLFEKRAVGLICHNDALYFISPEDDNFGYIWKYELYTGKLYQFSDILASSICLIDNQFYCMGRGDAGHILPHSLAPTGDYYEETYIYCGVYNDYYLAYQRGTNELPLLCLVSSVSNEATPLITNDIYISEQSIYKDSLYYRCFVSIDEADANLGNICSVNLLTGDRNVYDIEALFGHSHELSYTFANDRLYLMNEAVIAEIDLTNNAVIMNDIQNLGYGAIEAWQYQNSLYSDGESVYLVIRDLDGNDRLATIVQETLDVTVIG